jgi:hypothetical protein
MAPSKSTLARSRSSSNSKSRPLSRSASPKSSRTRSRSGTKESAACRSRTRSRSAPKSGHRSRSASRASASKTQSKRRTAPKAGSRGHITVSQKSVDKIKRPVVISKATKPARRMTAYNLFVREQMPNHSGVIILESHIRFFGQYQSHFKKYVVY